VLKTILLAPAWLLFGAPGVALSWLYRPNRFISVIDEDDQHKQVEQLFLLDELANEAKTNGHVDNNEDYYIALDYYDNSVFERMNGDVDNNEDIYVSPDYYDNFLFESAPGPMDEKIQPETVISDEILKETKEK
jgi:hypothetical protein